MPKSAKLISSSAAPTIVPDPAVTKSRHPAADSIRNTLSVVLRPSVSTPQAASA